MMNRIAGWLGYAPKAESPQPTEYTAKELAAIIFGDAGTNHPIVSEETAMRVAAVYACVALIAGAISTLPVGVYRRTEEGREKVDHDYWWLLNEQPNSDMSAAVFHEYLMVSFLFYGNAYAEIIRPSYSSSRVEAFVPHHPSRVTPFRYEGKKLYYRVQPEYGAAYILDPADIIHVPCMGYDGLKGISPITYAGRQAIGAAIATNDFSSNFFSNGARPDFVLKTQGKLSEDAAKTLRETWYAKHRGTINSHIPAILTGGLDVQQLTMSAEDSQLLATRTFQVEEIARILGVPPFMIGHTEKTTSWGSGVENMGRGFVKFTLLRHLVKFAQEYNRKLWPTRQRYFVEHNVAGLERGDLKSENESLRIALGRAGEPGWMTQNEVRRIKNLPPMKDESANKLTEGTNAYQTAGKEPEAAAIAD